MVLGKLLLVAREQAQAATLKVGSGLLQIGKEGRDGGRPVAAHALGVVDGDEGRLVPLDRRLVLGRPRNL
jgi:hypothetical protein